MRYNAKFRKVAPTADTVLTEPADFSFPRLNQKEYKELKDRLDNRQFVHAELVKFREALEAQYKKKETNRKAIEAALEQYGKHVANGNVLAERCAKDLKACGVQGSALNFSMRRADAWQKEYEARKKKFANDEIDDEERAWFKKTVKENKAAEAETLKEILIQIVLIVKAASVMP